jgi:hypothetical protein
MSSVFSVCDRVADVAEPRVPSLRERCIDCDVWLWAPVSRPLIATPVCLTCAAASLTTTSTDADADIESRGTPIEIFASLEQRDQLRMLINGTN